MISHKTPARRSTTRRLGGGLLAALLLSGCTDFAGYDLDYIMGKVPFLATMRSTVAYKPQQLPRMPAPGTVPVSSPGVGEVLPMFTQLQLDSAAATLTNPFPSSPEVLARGESVYGNQCAVCHGAQGEGNGSVVGSGRFPLGPTLASGTATGRSDGYIYATIRVGRGLMPPYGERISHNDRWAVVTYVRQLQAQGGGAPAAAPPAAPSAPDTAPAAQPAPTAAPQ